MKKQRFLALLVALCLLLALLPTAGAAAPLTLHWVSDGNGGAHLTVSNVPGGQGVYAVQLEVSLLGSYPSLSLTLPEALAETVYQAPPTLRVSGGVTSATFYLHSDAAINSGISFELGTVRLDGPFLQPTSATLTLLDRALAPLPGADRAAVTLSSTYSPLPFTDVASTDWFYDVVQFVYGAGIMQGVSDDLFSPKSDVTRGMLVTILHRLEGTPGAPDAPFDDVAADKWYAPAIGWAAQAGVVQGYSAQRFAPDAPVTREQLCTILYRYAGQKTPVSGSWGSLAAFPDQGTISPYAREAMDWAVHTGLLRGMETGRLEPQGNSTRAQVAAILSRFCALSAAP